MEPVIELTDLTVNRIDSDKFKINIEHNSDNNTHIIFAYLFERLHPDSDKDIDYSFQQEYSLNVKANSVKSFQQYLENNNYRLEYDVVLKILQELSNIILYLERKQKTIIQFSLDDLIVLDNDDFLFVNNENIFNFTSDKSKRVTISIPLEMNKFSSPELNQVTEIPFTLDYRAGYFSLASFLCYCLFAETLIDKEESEIEKLLEPIYDTKLYRFISRCGEKNINNRICLFI